MTARIALAGLLFAWTVSGSAAEPASPLIVAHRGLLKHSPENTLSNFRACLQLRTGFEFDVNRTKDGALVCIHDDDLSRTTNGSGKVSETTLEELKRLDAGSWFDRRFAGEKVPTVEEVLKLLANNPRRKVLVTVDLKAADVEQEVVRLAEQQGVLDRLLFIGRAITIPEVRQSIRQASPQAHVAALANTADELTAAIADPHSDWVYVRFVPTSEQVKAIHTAGKQSIIVGTTVSDHTPETWKQAAAAGIDAIMTDYPLELATALREW